VGWFQGLADGSEQVDDVLQASREGGDDSVGVIAGAVEAPVHRPLHPQPQSMKLGGSDERGGGHRPVLWTRSAWVASRTRPAYTATSRPVTLRRETFHCEHASESPPTLCLLLSAGVARGGQKRY
jgi:hypothetical protein